MQTHWSQSGEESVTLAPSPSSLCSLSLLSLLFLLLPGSERCCVHHLPQGKGIFIVRDLQQVMDQLECDQKSCKMASRPTARIVQRYC